LVVFESKHFDFSSKYLLFSKSNSLHHWKLYMTFKIQKAIEKENQKADQRSVNVILILYLTLCWTGLYSGEITSEK